jgi:hypothetical protein
MTRRFSRTTVVFLGRGYLFVAVAAATMLLVRPLEAGIPGSIPHLPGNSSPASPPFGKTYDILSQEWWLWAFMQAVPDNPIAGAPCSNGQSGDVWFLAAGPPTVSCTIPAGKTLFFPIVNTECSSLEPGPFGSPGSFHGDTPEERRACAKAWTDHITGISAEIDEKRVANLAPLRTRSGDFSFTVPNNNILFVPGPAWGFSSAEGFYVLLSPLPAGTHTIHVKGTFHDPFTPGNPVVQTIETTFTLTVL